MTRVPTLTIHVDHGALGIGGVPLDTLMRLIALHHGGDEKYGVDVQTDLFMMHHFCWCNDDDCWWCVGYAPHFVFYPTGLTVRWYKYIGRDTETNRPVTSADISAMATAILGGSEDALVDQLEARQTARLAALRAALR